MNVNPYNSTPRSPEPEFNWETVIEKTAILPDIRSYLERETEPDPMSAPLVEMLQESADTYCASEEDRDQLDVVFPNMAPATAAFYLVSSDFRTVLTREIVKTNPTFVSRVIANDAAMKIVGGSAVDYFKHRDPGLSFKGSPEALAQVGRIGMFRDMLQYDDPKASIPVVSRALDAHTSELAVAAVEAYGHPGSWIMKYADSAVLRHGLFRDGIKEATIRHAITNADHPLFSNLEPSSQQGARMVERATSHFEDSRATTLAQLGSLSLSLNSN